MSCSHGFWLGLSQSQKRFEATEGDLEVLWAQVAFAPTCLFRSRTTTIIGGFPPLRDEVMLL